MEHSTAVTLVLLLALGTCQALPQGNDNFVFPKDDDTPVRSFNNRGSVLETRLSVSGERRPGSTGVRLAQTADTAAPAAANCSWANQSVFYQPTGQCETLFFQGPCTDTQWLVIVNNVPQCQEQPCTEGSVQYQNKCEKIKDSSPCPQGMVIKAIETGEGECDCQEGHVFWAPTDRCYELLLRGPCLAHQMLVLPAGAHEARCRPNRCKDGQVEAVMKNGRVQLASVVAKCRDLLTRGPCIEENTVLLVDPKTMSLTCGVQRFHIRVLINAPLIECSPGSRRSASGQCRRAFK